MLCLTSAALTPNRATATAMFLGDHAFWDDFAAADATSGDYWTGEELGGVGILNSDQTGLTFSIPDEPTTDSFYGIVAPFFSLKADSAFELLLRYRCLEWPSANGAHVVLMVFVWDTAHKKYAYQLSVSRDSNNFSRQEEYSLSIWKGTGPKAKHVWKTKVTSDQKGALRVTYLDGRIRAKAGSLSYEFKPKETKLGAVQWLLKVSGQRAYWGNQPVSVGLRPFYVWSAKGFSPPAPSDD